MLTMSEYLCRVCIDLKTVPKNQRNDIVLSLDKHFENSIIVFEQKQATVKIVPSETSVNLSKTFPAYSQFNKPLLDYGQNKNIFVFKKVKASALEESIFATFEKSTETDLKCCVDLEYNSKTGKLCIPSHRKRIKNARKTENRHVHPRPLTEGNLYPDDVIYMLSDDTYTNGLVSLQYCVANVVQPNVGILSKHDVYSDRGNSIESSVSQSISSLQQIALGNLQSDSSLQTDAATSHYSGAVTVSSNGESDREFVQQPRHPGFAMYSSRKSSFATWHQFIRFNIDALVRAGFYYTGHGTIVRCFFCGTELANLTSDDDPLLEHVRKLPSCGYLRSNLGPRRIEEYQARFRNGSIDFQQANGTLGDRVTSRNPGPWSASDRIRSPQYEAYSIRLSSFRCWPSDISQRPEQVADAGFYYTGLQDVVRCFACDGGLKNWDPEDEPWIEHARWFPQCPFVKRVKGQEFIDLVKRMAEDEDEEEDAVVHSTFQPNNPTMDNELNHQLDQDNAEDVLETDAAKYTLNEGYSREIVATAINDLLMKGKSDYTSKDIKEFILERKDKGGSTMGTQRKMNPSTMPGPSSQTTNDSKRRLFEENLKLRQIMQCVTCKVDKRDILLLPCTHLCLCSHCADETAICPLCYKKIREKIKTYVI